MAGAKSISYAFLLVAASELLPTFCDGLSNPGATASDTSPSVFSTFKARAERIKTKVTTKDGWIGDYDYAWLCTPKLPFKHQANRPPPFYALDDDLPLVLAISSGLQHALAMWRTPSFRGYYLGTGLISVVGTSFATLSTANAIFNAMYKDGTCPSTTAADGTITQLACPEAYGKVLGTSLICSFLEIFMSFCSPKVLRRVFPPLVTGTVILLIGASLMAVLESRTGGGLEQLYVETHLGHLPALSHYFCSRPLPWGSPEFIGLGFLSFVTIILTEIFGSPFLKNISIIVGLVVGCIVAAAAGYASSVTIKTAPAITFLWVHTFKLGVYPPAILPMLAVYGKFPHFPIKFALIFSLVSLAMEAIGDITASAEVSRQPVVGDVFDSRIQGGILSDGLSGFFSALFTVTPLSVFAQNNGVIAITRCANRGAGRWCCAFLILFGVLGKIAGVFLAIPNPVLGGVTTFLFANVASIYEEGAVFLSAALTFGLGNLLQPDIFTHLFDGVRSPNKGLQGLFDSITIILSTPFLSAGVVAAVLNLILAEDRYSGAPCF
ncbi:xanthine/uracil permease [Pholiota molesta]|nr:xanthine/uracil permease [Pholiota molesta]